MYHVRVVIEDFNPSIFVQKILGEMWKFLVLYLT